MWQVINESGYELESKIYRLKLIKQEKDVKDK